METGDIFLITSVINTGNTAWSYCATRSFFSPAQRFEQTLQTIESIRTLAPPHTRILFVECSDISEEMTATLKSKVDIFLQTYDDADVRNACLNSEKKGYGEAKKTQRAVEYLLSNNIKFNRLFKISGRYFLNSNFDAARYSSETYTFREKVSGTNSTVVYSVPFCLLEHFYEQIKKVSEVYSRQVIGYELVLPSFCIPMSTIKVVGVSGMVAVSTNEFFSA